MLTDASRSTPPSAQMGEFDDLRPPVILCHFFSERETEACRDPPDPAAAIPWRRADDTIRPSDGSMIKKVPATTCPRARRGART